MKLLLQGVVGTLLICVYSVTKLAMSLLGQYLGMRVGLRFWIAEEYILNELSVFP